MSTKYDGGFAYPANERTGDGAHYHSHLGMTLRDHFAGNALQGMLAYPGCDSRGSHHNNNDPAGVAELAYRYADAMLAERSKP